VSDWPVLGCSVTTGANSIGRNPMQLSAEQIKQGIQHPAGNVRDVSVSYFAETFSRDPDIMPRVIGAIETYGWKDAFHGHSFFQDLVQTEETLIWAIEQLQQRGETDNEDETGSIKWLLDIIHGADPELVKGHQDGIRQLEVVGEDAWHAIEERILLNGFTADRLWDELEAFCESNKAGGLTADEVEFAHRLVEAMGAHPAAFTERVLDIIAQDIEDYTDNPMTWMEPCAVRLAGELRLEQATPLIIGKLHEDDETLNPDCVRSLVKIGTDTVADALADGFREAQWWFRFHACEVFETIHTDRSLERFLELLQWEEDLMIRCRLAQAALMNFADEAIEPARQLVLNADLSPEVIEVRNDLLAVSTLMGVELPERQRWQEAAKHDIEFRKQWYAKHYLDDDEDEYPDDDDDDEPPILPMDTVVREEPRIGRNDPCPCGSGKKYKKCCLKRRNGPELPE